MEIAIYYNQIESSKYQKLNSKIQKIIETYDWFNDFKVIASGNFITLRNDTTTIHIAPVEKEFYGHRVDLLLIPANMKDTPWARSVVLPMLKGLELVYYYEED